MPGLYVPFTQLEPDEDGPYFFALPDWTTEFDPMAFILALLPLLPQLAKLGMDITDLVNGAIEALNRDGGPSDEDWTKLHAAEDALRARLQAPR